jgi:putative endonuclease
MLSRKKGDKVERFVEHYLKQKGLRFVDRNYHSRYGEIDLIMQDTTGPKASSCLVFIEVRFRANVKHGSGAESVNYSKQQKIIKTAQFFLQQSKKFQHLNCRFDVVSVTLQHKSLSADWLKDAFQLPGW